MSEDSVARLILQDGSAVDVPMPSYLRNQNMMPMEPNRPARYTKPDAEPAQRQPWLINNKGLKSASSMLRGAECWTCKDSLPTTKTNELGPRYCTQCLKKKFKSKRRKANKLKVRKAWSSPNVARTKHSWGRKDTSIASSR